MTPSEIIESLLDSLSDFEEAHEEAERAYQELADLDQRLAEYKADLMAQISEETEGGKPRFSNDDKRKAELNRRLQERCATFLEIHATAVQYKAETAARVARLQEAIKTYRAVLAYYTSAAELQAARIQAATAAEVLQPAGVDDSAIPWSTS